MCRSPGRCGSPASARACGTPCRREGLRAARTAFSARFQLQLAARSSNCSGQRRQPGLPAGNSPPPGGSSNGVGERTGAAGVVVARLEAGAQVRGEERLVGGGRRQQPRAGPGTQLRRSSASTVRSCWSAERRALRFETLPARTPSPCAQSKDRPPQGNGLIPRPRVSPVCSWRGTAPRSSSGARSRRSSVRRVKSSQAQFHGLSQSAARFSCPLEFELKHAAPRPARPIHCQLACRDGDEHQEHRSRAGQVLLVARPLIYPERVERSTARRSGHRATALPRPPGRGRRRRSAGLDLPSPLPAQPDGATSAGRRLRAGAPRRRRLPDSPPGAAAAAVAPSGSITLIHAARPRTCRVSPSRLL